MEILLIEPPYYRLLGEKKRWAPVGLLYLAGVLEEAGHNVIVYNADADYNTKENYLLNYSQRHFLTRSIHDSTSMAIEIFNELREVIITQKPDLVGISVKSDCVPIVIKIIKLVKDICGKTRVILGGPHFFVDRECPYFHNVDKIFIGEAEGALLDYVGSINVKIPSQRQLPTFIPGSFSLDSLPLLSLKNLPDFQSKNINMINKQMLSASRGCPFRCYFCYKSIDKGSTRYLSGSRIVENMVSLNEGYSINKFYIVDDTFGINLQQISDMHYSLKKGNYNLTWTCMSHVRVLDEYKIVLMKEMGCTAVHLGIESGSEKILKLIGKNVTVSDILKCTDLLNKYNIDIRVFMIVGLPFEDDSDVTASTDLMLYIKPDEIAAQVYQPYPNTILYNQLLENDITIKINWQEFIRCNINYSIYKGQAKEDIDARIKYFLHFADVWNSNH